MKMEDEHRRTAKKEIAAPRATDARALEDTGRLIAARNERQAERMPTLFSRSMSALGH
jgi:hypothetical protein